MQVLLYREYEEKFSFGSQPISQHSAYIEGAKWLSLVYETLRHSGVDWMAEIGVDIGDGKVSDIGSFEW